MLRTYTRTHLPVTNFLNTANLIEETYAIPTYYTEITEIENVPSFRERRQKEYDVIA